MKTEYEVVFSNINREETIQKIKEIWWICTKENTLMKRVVFTAPNWWTWSYLRVRDEWNKITCTYKETREWKLDITSVRELETEVWDFDTMVWIYRKLWLTEKSFQESYREIWKIWNEIEFMIDLWPWLNPYIEIEWWNEEIVKKYSEILGFDYSDWLFGSSFQIYEKELGIDFDTMNNLKEITFANFSISHLQNTKTPLY